MLSTPLPIEISFKNGSLGGYAFACSKFINLKRLSLNIFSIIGASAAATIIKASNSLAPSFL